MNSYYKGFRPKSLKFLDTTHITTRLLHHQLFFKFNTSQLLQQGNYMHPACYYPFNSNFYIQILQTDFVHSPIYLFTQLCQFLAMSPQWCVELRQLLQAHNSPFSHERLTITRGATSPTLYELCKGSFLSHRIYMCKSSEKGTMVYRPYLTRLESVTIYRCLYKGSVIFPQLF